jgi:acyl dehydratase
METRMGLHYEELEVGRAFDLGSRRLALGDLRAFADLSGDRNPLHLDPEYAQGTVFAGPVAHGALGIAVATGLFHQAGITAGTLVALVGLEWRFVAPVRPDETVSARAEVLDRRPTRRAGQGIVRFRVVLTDQAGGVLQDGVLTEIVRRRPG